MATGTANVIRSQVVNGLHDPITEMVLTIDADEVAVRVHLDQPGATLTPALRHVLGRLVRARDAYVEPLVERAIEEGS
jgi:hypothetical protein